MQNRKLGIALALFFAASPAWAKPTEKEAAAWKKETETCGSQTQPLGCFQALAKETEKTFEKKDFETLFLRLDDLANLGAGRVIRPFLTKIREKTKVPSAKNRLIRARVLSLIADDEMFDFNYSGALATLEEASNLIKDSVGRPFADTRARLDAQKMDLNVETGNLADAEQMVGKFLDLKKPECKAETTAPQAAMALEYAEILRQKGRVEDATKLKNRCFPILEKDFAQNEPALRWAKSSAAYVMMKEDVAGAKKFLDDFGNEVPSNLVNHVNSLLGKSCLFSLQKQDEEARDALDQATFLVTGASPDLISPNYLKVTDALDRILKEKGAPADFRPEVQSRWIVCFLK